ncbi:hypothetical protein V6N13_040092 [Hibiscus sabdariffa]|uniref:Uncharacterized protein n=2 Tax=Hibiscus sabdariffa TaxID=183260 RepID=A0ABR2STG3_9ROSI
MVQENLGILCAKFNLFKTAKSKGRSLILNPPPNSRQTLSCFDLLNPRTSLIIWFKREKMPLGLISGIGRTFRRKRTSSLDILSSKRAPRDYYKGKNCKSTGFHTRKGGYVVMQEKLPNYVVPDLTDFKLKSYVSQCPTEVETAESAK